MGNIRKISCRKQMGNSRSRETMRHMPSDLLALVFCCGQDAVYPAAVFIEVIVLRVEKGVQVHPIPVQ